MTTTKSINRRFTAKLRKSSKPGGWTYVIWPESVRFFGTRGLVKIKGTIDGQPFRSSFMAMGNGKHMLPVKASVRKAIGKEAGKSVGVYLSARIDRYLSTGAEGIVTKKSRLQPEQENHDWNQLRGGRSGGAGGV